MQTRLGKGVRLLEMKPPVTDKPEEVEIDLGVVKTLQVQQSPAQLLTGWYIDPETGLEFYYDAATRKYYTLENGVYVPLNYIMVSCPNSPVSKKPGDQLTITLKFGYIGPAVSGASLYFGWGKSVALIWTPYGGTGGPGEFWNNSYNIPANQSNNPVTITETHTFTIPANADQGQSQVDVLVQLNGGSPSVGNNYYGWLNAVQIVGATPTLSGLTLVSLS